MVLTRFTIRVISLEQRTTELGKMDSSQILTQIYAMETVDGDGGLMLSLVAVSYPIRLPYVLVYILTVIWLPSYLYWLYTA